MEKIKGVANGRHVWLNGRRVMSGLEYVSHSPDGFNWGYGGSGPAQLAAAVLIEYHQQRGCFGIEAWELSRPHYQRFKTEVISGIKNGEDFDIEVDLSKYV